MCCGSRRNTSASRSAGMVARSSIVVATDSVKGKNNMMKAFAQPPEEALLPGFTLVQYVGRNWGASRFYGPVSGEVYISGLSIPFLPVRKEDLRTGKVTTPGILEMRRQGTNIFVLPGAKKADPVASALGVDTSKLSSRSSDTVSEEKPDLEPSEISSVTTVGTPETLEILPVGEYTVKDIKKLHLTTEEWEDLLSQELAGEQRSGVIGHIQKVLASSGEG